MYQYDDPEKTIITVMGTKYRAVARKPHEVDCTKCVFNDPAYTLLLGAQCSRLPCLSTERDTPDGVFFTEIPDDSL